MSAKQYAAILRITKDISNDLKKTRREINDLKSIQGCTTAEINALKEHIDIALNLDWFKGEIDRLKTDVKAAKAALGEKP